MPTPHPESDRLVYHLVYDGPGRSGRSKSVRQIARRFPRGRRTEVISLTGESERLMWVDLLAPELILRVATVRGEVPDDPTSDTLYRLADGFVLVVDSQATRRGENTDRLRSMFAAGRPLAGLPFVFQYNKRDLDQTLTETELDEALPFPGAPRFDTVATSGEGVFAAFEAAALRIGEAHDVVPEMRRLLGGAEEGSEILPGSAAADHGEEGPRASLFTKILRVFASVRR